MVERAESLPILIARFNDESIARYLEGVALAREGVYVPLVSPPVSAGLHVLQVHLSGHAEPLSFLAEVLGPCNAKGAPLRLAPVPSDMALAGATAKETPVNLGGSSDPPVAAVAYAGTAAADRFVGRPLASGKLLIEARVGEGGAGTVYRARHRDLQMPVAVKVMHDDFQRDPEFCKRFQAEALSASRLDHAHLTRVLDFGQEPDGLLYIAMEFLDGKSLREVLDAEKTLSFERVAKLMIQVCSGLTHAHARSIVHRDIKPENLMLVRGLDEDGRETDIVKVCDFGIAHGSGPGTESVFAGTAEYVSPEQYRGESPDAQSDVYSCGVVLYELLTGVVPIAGDMPEIVGRVATVVPDPPSRHVRGLDPRIDRLVLKALAKDREVRHASVRELRTELKETAEEIALFSAGGYYDVPDGMSSRPPMSSGRAPVAPNATVTSSEDWLERGTGYHASAPPVSTRNAVPPARLSQPSMPSMRAARPSYSDVEGPPSSRRSPVLPSLGPPPARHSIVDASELEDGAVLSGSHVSMTPSSESDEVGRAVAAFMKSLVATTDPEKFAALVAPLDPKVTALVEQGHIAAAWKLCSALSMIATEPAGGMSRGPAAHAALAIYSDRAVLAHVAEYALDPLKDRDGLARKLLIRAGDRGAHAAYGARTKHGVFEARERFVEILQRIGGAGLPTLRKALAMLETRLGVPGAISIAEDLLKSVPEIRDEELGQCIARYAKGPHATLALLATRALPSAWGPRSRPILVSQLHHKDADVAITAMKCLRPDGGIDDEVVGQLRSIVLGTVRGIPAVRLAATEVLGGSAAPARAQACSVLAEALASTHGATPDVEELVVALSSAIIAAKGDPTLVAERWKTSSGFLRTRLERLLRQAR